MLKLKTKFYRIFEINVCLYLFLRTVNLQQSSFMEETMNNVPYSLRPFYTIFFSYSGLISSIYTPNFANIENIKHAYDYIIVGAGSAGCVLANRLTENPLVKVLLLEAGGAENIVNSVPFFANMLQRSSVDWKDKTTSQKSAARGMVKNQITMLRGKIIGGSFR